MTNPPPARPVPIVALFMGFTLFLYHLVVNRQYGFHGDEMYFVVCGQRAAWGFVDHPPFVPMVARVATELMGITLFALRFFPALALGVGCVLTGWLARRLGAGRYGEFLAALGFVCAPFMLRLGAILNIPAFEVVFWLVVAHLIVTIGQRDDARWWVVVGAVAGIALLNKHTTLFLGTGIAVGLVLTARRKDLATPWPWVGGAAAFVVFLPNLIWQYRHDWATFEFVSNIHESAMEQTPRALFVVAQVIFMNPFNAVLCAAGLYFFLRSPSGKPYRMLGWIFLTTASIMIVFQAKVYYLVPAYPMVYAGGAVALERAWSRRWAWGPRTALVTGMAAMAVLFAPIVSPIGSVSWKDGYVLRVLGYLIDDPTDLTFDFHYQLGRPEERDAFLAVFDGLAPEEQSACVLLTGEYDSVSNLTLFGPAMGLPKAFSGSNSYYLWGPGDASGDCVIAMGYDEALLKDCFADVRQAGAAPPVLHRDGEKPRPIYVCTEPKESLAAMWPRFKRYR